MISPDEIKLERRRNDTLSHIVSFLFLLMLSGLTWWMNKIDNKAERVPVLEERIANMQTALTRIETGVTDLVNRKK